MDIRVWMGGVEHYGCLIGACEDHRGWHRVVCVEMANVMRPPRRAGAIHKEGVAFSEMCSGVKLDTGQAQTRVDVPTTYPSCLIAPTTKGDVALEISQQQRS